MNPYLLELTGSFLLTELQACNVREAQVGDSTPHATVYSLHTTACTCQRSLNTIASRIKRVKLSESNDLLHGKVPSYMRSLAPFANISSLSIGARFFDLVVTWRVVRNLSVRHSA